MNKKYKQPWIDALRSGKYKQGPAYLRTLDDKFCCLGVLCEVGRIVPKENDYNYIYDGSSSSLSDKLSTEFGLNDILISTLINMNDSAKMKFQQIADWVENNL